MIKTVVLGLLLALGAMAQSPSKLVDGNGSELQLAAGGKKVDTGLILATGSPVAYLSATTTVQLIHCHNATSSAATVTITDGAGSPVTYFPAVSLAGNSVMIANYGTVGMSFAGGVKVSAGTTSAIYCRIIGVQ